MPNENNVALMIMLATQAQIVNYKTYKHYDPDRVVALCSESALKRNWCAGFEKLLGAKFRILPPFPDSMMGVFELAPSFLDRIQPELERTAGRVVWAWSGAQKPHSTALYLLARQYAEMQPDKHILVYADGNSNAFYEDGRHEPIVMNAPLAAEEVLLVHGLQLPRKRKADAQVSSPEELRAFLTDQQAREREWQPPPFAAAFGELAEDPAASRDDVIKLVADALPEALLDAFQENISTTAQKMKLLENEFVTDFLNAINVAREHPVCSTLFQQAAQQLKLRQLKQENTGQRTSGASFEYHARARMQQWYDQRGKENNLVASMAFDVDVEGINLQGEHGTRNPESAAQFDCLLVTPQGRFIAIDFKSAGKKNYRAQQASVTIAGGVYAALYYLYPWIEEDLPVPAGATDPRPKNIRKRMQSIVSMDKARRPEGKPTHSWRGIRFYKNDEDFFDDLETILQLKQAQ